MVLRSLTYKHWGILGPCHRTVNPDTSRKDYWRFEFCQNSLDLEAIREVVCRILCLV